MEQKGSKQFFLWVTNEPLKMTFAGMTYNNLTFISCQHIFKLLLLIKVIEDVPLV